MSEQNFAGPPSDSKAGTPATSAPPRQPMTRRNVFRAAGVAGVFAAVGGAAAYFGTRSDATNTSTAADGSVADGPVVAYLRNSATGEIEIFVGTTKTTIRDPSLAARLASAASAPAHRAE